MGLTIDIVLALHAKAPGKVNLTYKKPGGTWDYCYLDPSKPMSVAKGARPRTYGTLIQHIKDFDQFKTGDVYMTFFKQKSGAELQLNIAHVEFQNKNKEEMLKLIYATN